jgi:hypothetical protein
MMEHEHNAYCQGNVHACVIYAWPTWQPDGMIRHLEAEFGYKVLGLDPAPEAVPFEDVLDKYVDLSDYSRPAPAPTRAWLLRWEEPEVLA